MLLGNNPLLVSISWLQSSSDQPSSWLGSGGLKSGLAEGEVNMWLVQIPGEDLGIEGERSVVHHRAEAPLTAQSGQPT